MVLFRQKSQKVEPVKAVPRLVMIEGPIRRPERGREWEPIKILLEGD
jgi:hypothetical protein